MEELWLAKEVTKKLTVVVVEDEQAIRGALVRMLSRNGFAVLEYGDPLEAISDLNDRTTPADLLLTDVILPNMSGMELAERLELPTVFMSGFRAVVNSQRGGDGLLLVKPFSNADLKQAVRKRLGGRQPVRAGERAGRLLD